MDLTSLWKKVYSELEIELGKHQTGLYFRNSQLKSLDDNTAIVTLPNRAVVGVITNRFLGQLTTSLRRQTHQEKLAVALDVEQKKTPIEDQELGPLFSQENISSNLTTPRPAVPNTPEPDYGYQKTHLAAKYTFNTFVVGSTNNLAHAAALSIVKNPGKEFNPFFIYGGVGIGKTHLMQAIGNELYLKNKSFKVMYVSAETFMNELIESFGTKSTDQFRRKYRLLDVLMIDDIQFISGKESTQDEIFHTFNSLHQADKQIILTSDRRPAEIEKVESRIISRFMGGMTVDIQAPDFEMRTAIINEKLVSKGENWDREAVEYVASTVDSNVREIEGVLTRLLTQAKVSQRKVDLNLVREQLGRERAVQNTHKASIVEPKTIITLIARQYGITIDDLMSDKRDAEFVVPRQMAMFILRTQCGTKLTEVARLLNRKDHTTVLHAVGKIQTLSKTDPHVREQLVYIKKELWG